MIRTLTVILALICLTACGKPATETETKANGPAIVMATNYPLYYFAQRLTDDGFNVQLPVPEEGDPAFWQPDEAAINAMQAADLILLNGATYEKWLPTVSLPTSRLVDTSASFATEYITLHIKHTHSHGGAGEHAHAGTAFTTWLDMTKAEAQAEAIAAALIKLRPKSSAAIEARLASLTADLRALDQALHDATPDGTRQIVLASHPVYDYLAKRYELRLSSLLWEPETMPSEQDWKDFAFRKVKGVQWMIYEDEPSAEIRAELTKRGVTAVVFRPCGNRPPTGDFLTEMQANIERLRSIYTP